MTSLAIVSAARTTVPVTWTSPAGQTATAKFPTHLHAAYAGSQHSAVVVQLADNPNVAPATAVQSASTGGVLGLGGGALVGLGIVVWFVAKWKTHPKEIKRTFFLGAVAAILLGSWGLFGIASNTVKSTGDSVGNSVSNTIGQQTVSR